MADVKPKALYTDRLNPKYAGNPNADRKRQQAEAFETLNHFVRKHGGAITSPPGDKTLRVEAPKGSELPARLRSQDLPSWSAAPSHASPERRRYALRWNASPERCRPPSLKWTCWKYG